MLPMLSDAEPPIASQNLEAETPPFLLEHRHAGEGADGSRPVPEARIVLPPEALRASGLIAALDSLAAGGDAARTLLAVLASVTAGGRVHATAPGVAALLGVTDDEALTRLRRLAGTQWKGAPLLHMLERGGPDIDAFVPSRCLMAERIAEPEPTPSSVPPPVRVAGRTAIVTRSRARYARPREEVEREILERLGHAPVGATSIAEQAASPEGIVRRRLLSYGIAPAKADALLAVYPRERIERQIAWMGSRRARDPARFLASAIERDFEAPVAVRFDDRQQEESPPAAEGPGRSTVTEINTIERESEYTADDTTASAGLDGIRLELPPSAPSDLQHPEEER